MLHNYLYQEPVPAKKSSGRKSRNPPPAKVVGQVVGASVLPILLDSPHFPQDCSIVFHFFSCSAPTCIRKMQPAAACCSRNLSDLLSALSQLQKPVDPLSARQSFIKKTSIVFKKNLTPCHDASRNTSFIRIGPGKKLPLLIRCELWGDKIFRKANGHHNGRIL